MTTIAEYAEQHKKWSYETFGEGAHTEGLCKHIEKEVNEIRTATSAGEALYELADIIILAIDGMLRLGYSPTNIEVALLHKQRVNAKRKYPKITDENEPTEHVRTGSITVLQAGDAIHAGQPVVVSLIDHCVRVGVHDEIARTVAIGYAARDIVKYEYIKWNSLESTHDIIHPAEMFEEE